MPFFIRRRRGLDWSTPAEIRHLPPGEQLRLLETATLVAKGREWRHLLLFLFVFLFPSLVFGLLQNQIIDVVFFHLGIALPPWGLGLALFIIGMACFQLIHQLFALGGRQLVHQAVREQMLAEGIRPAVCFDCRYFTEGFDGDECPNCGTALVAPKPGLACEKPRLDLPIPELDRLLIHLPMEIRRGLKRTARQKVRQERSVRWVRRFLGVALLLAVSSLAASWITGSDVLWLVGMGVVVLLFIAFVPYTFRGERVYRRHLGELMRAAGIRPRFCLQCNHYVEGVEAAECPNCGATLVGPKSVPTAEET